jgi:hypothetical protein
MKPEELQRQMAELGKMDAAKSITDSVLIDLPSKGKVYTKNNPLSSGKLRLIWPTAEHENILFNPSYVKNGTMIQEFLKSIILSNDRGEVVNYDDLIIGDKNWLMVQARILLYGSEYPITAEDSDGNRIKGMVELDSLKMKELDASKLVVEHENAFEFILPSSKTKVIFRALTAYDESVISKSDRPESRITDRMSRSISSFGGITDPSAIQKAVISMRSIDSRELRKYWNEVLPDVIMQTECEIEGGGRKVVTVPFTAQFFWPD